MKQLLTTLIALNTLCVFGQTSKDNFFVLKGHISHNKDTAIQYGYWGLLGNELRSIRIDKQGNFESRVEVETEPQAIFLETDAGGQLYVNSNDTVNLEWDAKNPQKTFAIGSPNPDRGRELQTELTQWNAFAPKFNALIQSLYQDKVNDSTKAARINKLYNEQMSALLAGGMQQNTSALLFECYFRYAGQMNMQKLFPAFDLVLTDTPAVLKNSKFYTLMTVNHGKLYRIESEEAFLQSPAYRDFLYDYVRFNDPFGFSSALAQTPEEQKQRMLPFTPVWKEYYTALSSFRIRSIRDWFISRCIMDGFKYYSYAESEAVYKDFMTKNPTNYYATALKENYDRVQTLRPGSLAPDFSLRDDHGQLISLSSLRGKVVYMDFWGVYCAPCMTEINNHTAMLHEKYKDKNVAFVNICVDASEDTWKNTLSKSQLHGVNLITQFSGAECSTYNVSAVPRYYLIDRQGRIVDNNAPRPSEGASLTDILDKLLE